MVLSLYLSLISFDPRLDVPLVIFPVSAGVGVGGGGTEGGGLEKSSVSPCTIMSQSPCNLPVSRGSGWEVGWGRGEIIVPPYTITSHSLCFPECNLPVSGVVGRGGGNKFRAPAPPPPPPPPHTHTHHYIPSLYISWKVKLVFPHTMAWRFNMTLRPDNKF